MIIFIPGMGSLDLKNVVFDLNGTLAVDGKVREEVRAALKKLKDEFNVVIASSDIHDTLTTLAEDMGVNYQILKDGDIGPQKAEIVRELGSGSTIAIGNGLNDWQMLREAAVGIAVLGTEGAATMTIQNADMVVKDVLDAIDCILTPKRMIATLRV